MISEELARRFRELREGEGLTREQLIENMNYLVSRLNPKLELKQRIEKHNHNKDDYRSVRQISNYETAKERITKEVAEVMALLFDINPKYLLDENASEKYSIDSMNKDLYNLRIELAKCAKEYALMYDAIKSLGTLNGYDVELNTKGYNTLSEYFENRRNYLILKNDDKTITLSDSDVLFIGNKLDVFFNKKLNEVERLKATKNKS